MKAYRFRNELLIEKSGIMLASDLLLQRAVESGPAKATTQGGKFLSHYCPHRDDFKTQLWMKLVTS